MQGNFDPVTFNMMLNMMNVMHPNMGYNINNYNNNMYNNQALMNMMMIWMNQNPFLQQMYNNMYQNFNQNQNQTNPNTGGTSSSNNPQEKYDPYPNSNNKINIAFTTQKGYKMIIVVPRDLPVKELLKMYILKVGLGPGVLKDEIIFVYNGLKVNNYEEKEVGSFFGFSGTNIVILDTKDIIGA
jgi:hypothetical protein